MKTYQTLLTAAASTMIVLGSFSHRLYAGESQTNTLEGLLQQVPTEQVDPSEQVEQLLGKVEYYSQLLSEKQEEIRKRKEQIAALDAQSNQYKDNYHKLINDGKINAADRKQLDAIDDKITNLLQRYTFIDPNSTQVELASALKQDIILKKRSYDEEQILIQQRAKYNEDINKAKRSYPGITSLFWKEENVVSALNESLKWYREAKKYATNDKERTAAQKRIDHIAKVFDNRDKFYERKREREKKVFGSSTRVDWNNHPKVDWSRSSRGSFSRR